MLLAETFNYAFAMLPQNIYGGWFHCRAPNAYPGARGNNATTIAAVFQGKDFNLKHLPKQ